MIGPQGSGKGTQAELIAKKLGIPAISAGELLRREAAGRGELAQKIKTILNQGKMVPNEITNELIRRRVSEPDARNGFILDGYPRDRAQAEALETYASPTHVLALALSDKEAVKRLAGRRVCPKDGKNYQLYAKFETTAPSQWACANPCGPDGKYNAGIAGGPDSGLTAFAAAPVVEGPKAEAEPSPLLAALIQGPQIWSISQRLAIPEMYELWTSTIDPASEGGSQEVQLKVKDSEADVTSVTATIKTDNTFFTKQLDFATGSARDGVWSGSWTITDTYNQKFMITFAAEDSSGNRAAVDFAIR
jgi:adenylate kinase family enzyme